MFKTVKKKISTVRSSEKLALINRRNLIIAGVVIAIGYVVYPSSESDIHITTDMSLEQIKVLGGVSSCGLYTLAGGNHISNLSPARQKLMLDVFTTPSMNEAAKEYNILAHKRIPSVNKLGTPSSNMTNYCYGFTNEWQLYQSGSLAHGNVFANYSTSKLTPLNPTVDAAYNTIWRADYFELKKRVNDAMESSDISHSDKAWIKHKFDNLPITPPNSNPENYYSDVVKSDSSWIAENALFTGKEMYKFTVYIGAAAWKYPDAICISRPSESVFYLKGEDPYCH